MIPNGENLEKNESITTESPNPNLQKNLTKRLEINLARHRMSVLLTASAAKERLERRLKEKSLIK